MIKYRRILWLLCITIIITACGAEQPVPPDTTNIPILPNDTNTSTVEPVKPPEETPVKLHIHDSDTIEDSVKKELGVPKNHLVYRVWDGELHKMILPFGFLCDPNTLNSFDDYSERIAYELEYTSSRFIDLNIDTRNIYYTAVYTDLTLENQFFNLGENNAKVILDESATSTTLLKLKEALTTPQSVMDLYDKTLTVINHYVFVSSINANTESDITIEMYLETDRDNYVYVYCEDLAEHDYSGYECNDGFMFSQDEYVEFCKATKLSQIENPTAGFCCFYRKEPVLLFRYVLKP